MILEDVQWILELAGDAAATARGRGPLDDHPVGVA